MNVSTPGDGKFLSHYRDALTSATQILGGTPAPETFRLVEAAGDRGRNPRRIYHTLRHFCEISQSGRVKLLEDMPSFEEEFRRLGLQSMYEPTLAVMMRAGAHHDIVYHVDADYIPRVTLRDETLRILPPSSIDAPRAAYQVTAAEPGGDAGVILDMARALFDVGPRDVLTQFNGKNEFLSAVHAGLQGLKEGIPLKYLLAEMMMIEATRPFDPPDRMDVLRLRFEAANRLLPAASQLDPQEIAAFMLGSVQLANVDVLDFARDFTHFLKGSVDLLHEAGRAISQPEDYFIQTANREAFFLNLLSKMHNDDAAVFHGLHVSRERDYYFPLRGVVDICEKRARENIRKDILMSRAVKISAALATAVETVYGQGDVTAVGVHLRQCLPAMLNGYPAMHDPSMTETAMAMRECAPAAPLLGLASYLLGNLSEPGLLRFSEKVSQQFQAYQENFTAAFATQKTARELLEWLKETHELKALEPIAASALGYGEKGNTQAQAR